MNNTCAHCSIILVQSVLDTVINKSLKAFLCILNKGYRKPQEGSSLVNITSCLPTCTRSSFSTAAVWAHVGTSLCTGTPQFTQKMNRPLFQWGSLISLPLMPPCASIWLWRCVRCEVLGGLCKATQFPKVEKSIRKTCEGLAFLLHADQMQLMLPFLLHVQLARTSEDIGIIMRFAQFSLLEHWQNSARVFHWFYLPNISCGNINLMGTSMYPVVPNGD